MTISLSTPVLIGAGQSNDPIGAPSYRAWSAADLAAAAAREAIADSGASGDLPFRIDAIGATPTFEDSRPGMAVPFGKSSNLPRSIARRLGLDPGYALWIEGGGNGPQDLVSEFCERIGAGEFEVALVAGAEAISTVRHAARQGRTLDFADDPDGGVENRLVNYAGFADAAMRRHGLVGAPPVYAMTENARRSRLGQSREAYALSMGELFARFAAVAHGNARSAWAVPAYAPAELTEIGPHNRWINDPYPLRLVARDQVSLGAAVLIASLGAARRMNVPEDRMIYLHGYARGTEKPVFDRPDLGASPTARRVARAALGRADLAAEDVALFDFYSCFPIAVSNVAIDEFGLAMDDPRGLTVTGGLPYFGGPGNNYSMHAIAEMVGRLRHTGGRAGFVGANGGYLSKYSVGIYSARPREWRACDSHALQAELDAVASVPRVDAFSGTGRVETYTVVHERGEPRFAVIAGRTGDGTRFLARSADDDRATTAAVHEGDPLGAPVIVASEDGVNWFRFG